MKAFSLALIAILLNVHPAPLAVAIVDGRDPVDDMNPPAPIRPDPEKFADLLKKEEKRIDDRMTRIREELADLEKATPQDEKWAKEWAGTYYVGDGLGQNVVIVLAPRGGIAYQNHGCLGLYDGDWGEIVGTYKDGLRFRLAIGREGGSFLSERVYFVRWGDRKYLVPGSKMFDFVNNYNVGGFRYESLFGIPMLQDPNGRSRRFSDAPPSEHPELPAAFAALLRDEPISLKVKSVGPADPKQTRGTMYDALNTIELEGGSTSGVFVGMEFPYPLETLSTSGGDLTITHTEADTCTATFSGSVGESKPPAIGEILLTSKKVPHIVAPSTPKDTPDAKK